MKRRLDPSEIAVSMKSIQRITEEVKDIEEVLLPDARLTYEKKLDYSYRKQKEQYKSTIADFENQVKEKKEQIAILEDQITNGVEPKGIKEVKQ